VTQLPADLEQHLRRSGQEHVVAWWQRLDEPQRPSLLPELRALDLEELRALYDQKEQKAKLPAPEQIAPLPRPHLDEAQRHDFRRHAEDAFRAGSVAFLVVAGGQGSRLGFEHPKGMFPIGPVSNKPLFQIHAEKVLALTRRYGRPLPFLVMTSPATDAETREFFEKHRNFGLPDSEVLFFCQGTMPALDLATGRLLFESPGHLFLSPNGHGGTLTGLADSGLLTYLQQLGVRTLSYFQVDNPLVDLADHVFLGQHLARDAEVSTKVLPKRDALEKVGNVLLVAGRCSIIEYSDLPEGMARATDEQGRPRLWAGNPAIHLFDLAFLQAVTGAAGMPWHLARKKVPFMNEQGQTVTPTTENALKFERFIFDVLPLADRWTVLETERDEEFAPVKNASGVDSPETSRQALTNLAGAWAKRAGFDVPIDAHGNVSVALEVSPLFALNAGEFAAKVQGHGFIDRPTYWSDR
jgi:UDP-N-acetylglucosamine/UDP-N-acetylgalactosamine diphosphorylase